MKLPILTLAATCLAASAVVFADAERTCPAGTPLLERWPAIPAGGLVFDLARGIGSFNSGLDTRPAPGFPNNAVIGFNCQLTSTELPIQQSISDAAGIWNNATMPGTAAVPSTFAINPVVTRAGTYPSWLAWTLDPFGTSLLGTSVNRNQITFWEHQTVMNAYGGGLAVALVSLVPGTGDIRDVDIAFNAHSTGAGGLPLFRFMEDNRALAATSGTMGWLEMTPTTTDPIEAYVDILGVLVHEFGHGAGLAHSLVDGPMNTSATETPTMFAQPQLTPYNSAFALPLQGCSNNPTVQANGAATMVGGLLGLPARTLAADDVASIAVGYPGPGQALLGTIAGRVVNGSGAAVRGAHVLAINTATPEVHRIGTFSDGAGDYNLSSLPAGSYYVYVESVDVAGYFANTGLPEFVDPSAGCGALTTFEPEFLDLADSALESSASVASTFVVAAGAITNVPNTVIAPVAGPTLRGTACRVVGANTICTPSSTRGAVHSNLGATSPTMNLT
ncbi:MAG: hypothetical protein ACI80K_000470, partial [Paracoccaceae bacterium]